MSLKNALTSLENKLISLVQKKYLPNRMKSLRNHLNIPKISSLFARDVVNLSMIYNHQRKEIDNRMFAKASSRAAYLIHYLPLNYAKTYSLLEMFADETLALLEASPTIRILDLGCGPGSSSLAFVQWMKDNEYRSSTIKNKKIIITGMDQNKNFLKDFSILFGENDKKYHLTTTTHNLFFSSKGKPKIQPFNIMFLSNFINELNYDPSNTRFMKDLNRIFKYNLDSQWGMVFFIEPALSKTSKNIMNIKSLLEPQLKTIGPCLHQNKCPLLTPEYKKEWCHDEIKWPKPKLIAALDRKTGLDHNLLRYSYLFICNKPTFDYLKQNNLCTYNIDHYRVVSNRIQMKKGTKQFLCGKNGITVIKNPPKNKMFRMMCC